MGTLRDALGVRVSPMTPLTPEEWERVECLAKNFAARPDELPITYIRTIRTTTDLSLLLRALAERTAERDRLREALKGLCVYPSRKCWSRYGCILTDNKGIWREEHDYLCLQARAALAPQEPTE